MSEENLWTEEPKLAPDFSRAAMHRLTEDRRNTYIRDTYGDILLQIQLAAENRHNIITLAASDCPVELAVWLFLQEYTILIKNKDSRKTITMTQASDYIESKAETITIIW